MLSDANGELVESGVLGVSGTVSLDAQSGQLISVFEDNTPAEAMRQAYGAVITADSTSVRFVHQAAPQPNPGVGVTVQSYCTNCTGATVANLSASCQTPATLTSPTGNMTFPLTNYQGCAGHDAADYFVVVSNVTGNPTQQVFELEVPLSAGTHQLPQTLAVTGVHDFAWSVSGAQAGFLINRSLIALTPSGREAELWRSINGTPTATAKLVVDFLAFPVRVDTQLIHPDTLTLVGHYQRHDPLTDPSAVIDAEALAAPEDGTALDESVPGRPGVAWQLAAGPEGDALQIYLATDTTRWTIALPVAAADVMRLPTLPTNLESFTLARGAVEQVGVVHADEPSGNGYAQFLLLGVTAALEQRRDLNELQYAADVTLL